MINYDNPAEHLGTIEGFNIYRIDLHEDAVKFSEATNWDISSEEFAEYRRKNGFFYVLINEKNQSDKYSFLILKNNEKAKAYDFKMKAVDLERFQFAFDFCFADANKFYSTIEYAIDKGLLPIDEFIRWWNKHPVKVKAEINCEKD